MGQEPDRLNAHELVSPSSRQPRQAATDANHFVLTFENNRIAGELFGQFDQNLKLLEQRLNIDARPRGNSVAITGDVVATNQARRALDFLYERLLKGGTAEVSDVEGAIRMAMAADDQLTLPTMERKAKISMAQISTRKKTIAARTPTQDVYMRRWNSPSLFSASALPAPARPIWLWRMRRSCWSAARSTVSSCRVRRWKRANAWASCRAT